MGLLSYLTNSSVNFAQECVKIITDKNGVAWTKGWNDSAKQQPQKEKAAAKKEVVVEKVVEKQIVTGHFSLREMRGFDFPEFEKAWKVCRAKLDRSPLQDLDFYVKEEGVRIAGYYAGAPADVICKWGQEPYVKYWEEITDELSPTEATETVEEKVEVEDVEAEETVEEEEIVTIEAEEETCEYQSYNWYYVPQDLLLVAKDARRSIPAKKQFLQISEFVKEQQCELVRIYTNVRGLMAVCTQEINMVEVSCEWGSKKVEINPYGTNVLEIDMGSAKRFYDGSVSLEPKEVVSPTKDLSELMVVSPKEMAVVEEAPKKSGFFSSIGGFFKKAVSAVKAKATSWWEKLKQVVSGGKAKVKTAVSNGKNSASKKVSFIKQHKAGVAGVIFGVSTWTINIVASVLQIAQVAGLL